MNVENPFVIIESRIESRFDEMKALLLDIKNASVPICHEPPDRCNLTEACEFTGQSKSQVYKLTMLRIIPHEKYGKRLVFSRKALTEWMLSRTISAPSARDVMTDRLTVKAKKRRSK